jgi:hypothetical protein
MAMLKQFLARPRNPFVNFKIWKEEGRKEGRKK